jgi:Spy/CpxP family protein refolding chaperone
MKATYTRKLIGAFALTLAILATGSVGFAQHGDKRGGHRGGFGRMFRALDLTETQQSQIQQIAERFRQQHKQTREARRGDKKDRFDFLAGGTFDETAVRAAAQARAAKRVEMEVSRARMMSEMYAVLTSEQKAKIAELRQQHEQRRQERRAARGANAVNQN